MSVSICAIAVIYEPNVVRLKEVVLSLYDQVDRIFIYDNSTNFAWRSGFEFGQKITLFGEAKNIGIGAAQNYVINIANKHGYQAYLMTDQDTIFPDGVIRRLYNILLSAGDDIAAVAPRRISKGYDGAYKLGGIHVYKGGKLKHLRDPTGVIAVSHVISSGMLIDSCAMENIGYMKEDLFIDWVDNEWCWRARSLGYKILFVSDIHVDHELGDDVCKILGREFTVRSDVRNYYIVRNSILLILYSKITSFGHKIYLFRMAIKHFYCSVYASKSRSKTILYLSKGIIHGIIGRAGSYHAESSRGAEN